MTRICTTFPWAISNGTLALSQDYHRDQEDIVAVIYTRIGERVLRYYSAGSPDYLFDSQKTPNLIAKKLAVAVEEQCPTISQCNGSGTVAEEGVVQVILKWVAKEDFDQAGKILRIGITPSASPSPSPSPEPTPTPTPDPVGDPFASFDQSLTILTNYQSVNDTINNVVFNSAIGNKIGYDNSTNPFDPPSVTNLLLNGDPIGFFTYPGNMVGKAVSVLINAIDRIYVGSTDNPLALADEIELSEYQYIEVE